MNKVSLISFIFSDLMKFFVENGKNFGLNFKGWIGPKLVVVLTEPSDLQILLNHPLGLDKGFLTKMVIRPTLGDGILISHRKICLPLTLGKGLNCIFFCLANKWKPRRRMVQSTFTKSILDTFHGEFVNQSNVLVNIMEKYVKSNGDKDVPINDYLMKTSLDIICSE